MALTKTRKLDVARLTADLTAKGARVFHVRGEKCRSRASFVAAVRRVLPLDPPVEDDDFDALEDSLFEGLSALPETSLAILWTGADDLLAGDPDAFDVALEILADLAHNLTELSDVSGAPQTLSVVVETTGS